MTRRQLPLLLVALLLLSSLAPLASAGEAWTKETGSAITAVATDERGDRIFVGTESGDLYCYDAGGNVVWSRPSLHGSGITKILASDDGAYVTTISAGALRQVDGGTGSTIASYSETMRDVAAPRDGSLQAGLYGSIDIRDADGRVIIIPAPTINQIAMDGSGEWLVGGDDGSTLTLYALGIPVDGGQWLMSPYSWYYRARHTISGSAGTVTNYPVEIKVVRGSGTSAGSTLYAPQCQSDFGDIRFTADDGVTQLPYYLKSIDGSTATFIVQIPELPASPASTSVYVYWGHATTIATTSDPAAQWIFYDDFEDGVLNPSLWVAVQVGSGTVVENGGYVDMYRSTSTTDYAYLTGPVLSGAPYHIISNVSFHEVPGAREEVYLLTTSGAGYPVVNTYDSSGGQRFTWGGDIYGAVTMETAQQLEFWWSPGGAITSRYGSDWNVTKPGPVSGATVQFRHSGGSSSAFHLRIYDYGATSWNTANLLPRSWGAVESIVTPLGTKTLDGTITNIDAPETGDWVAVSTTTKTYIIEVTPTGFGDTIDLGARTGTPYDVAIANNGANVIEGRGILADIFRLDGVQAGTYTAGGPVRTVAVAQKNGLYAAAGSDDGKYYIFSKDESSSWYLLHASDSEDPVTAIAMSWRGEIAVIGRADGSVTLYTTTDAPPPDSQMTVYAIKDGQPYIGKPVSVSTADVSDPDKWTPLYTILRTDSDGKIVISTHTGHYYQININNGEKIVVIQASSATPIHSVVFRSPLIYEKYSYDVQYNASSQAIEMTYTDNEGPATVSWSIVRTDTYSEVFSHTTSGVTTATATYPISEPDISYKVNVKVQRSSGGSIQNMWFITPQNASPIALPFWDENIQNAVFIIFLMILGGVFYYSTGAKGALIVALVAALFRYFSWITVPWFWIIAAVVFAFLANIAEGA